MNKIVVVFFFCVLSSLALFAENTSTPKRTAKTAMPRGVFFENAAVTIGGKIYLVTPWNVFEYDPKTDRWTDEKAVLSPFRHDFETVALNGKLYVVGGCTGGEQHIKTGAVDEYDPATHTWRSRAPMPTARMAPGVAAVNGKLFAIGGVNLLSPVNAVEVYDPATNAWSRKKNWSRTNANTVAVELMPGKIHLLSYGQEDGKPTSEFLDEYDPATDTFRVLNVPERRNCAGAAVISGRLVTFGGQVNDEKALGTIQSYDPAKNIWTALKDLPEPRSCPAAIQLDDKVYVIGGAPVPWKDPMASVIVADRNDVMMSSGKAK